MSRFLVLSDDGYGVGLSLRLEAEGHEVRTWVKDPSGDDFCKGLIQKADKYSYCQNVIADCTNFGALLDMLRDSGVATFGGSSFADELEGDRELSEEVMQSVKIDTPKSTRVSSWDDAAKKVERLAQNSGRVVLKPEGELSGVVPSYVAHDEADALAALKDFERQAGAAEPQLVIQEFIEGVAVSTEGWFNGEDWAEGMFNHTLEKKATLNGDLGPDAGCAGNIVWRCDSKDPIVEETLQKLTNTLREKHYVGPFDINCVVNKKGIYGLEFTPRFGYDAMPTLLYALCDFNFGSFVYDMAHLRGLGQALKEGFGTGVRLTLPKDNREHLRIGGLEYETFQSLYPFAVQYDDKNGFTTAPNSDHLGVVNAFGDTIGEAFARVYDVCSRIKVRGLGYRTDLSESLLKDFRELRQILTGEDEGWYGVDLDGTLAKYSEWADEIGEPLPVSVQRVKRHISEGKEVRIFTARGSVDGDSSNRHQQIVKIHDWVKTHIGTPLEVTHSKDPKMIRLDDDRVRQVDPETGALIGSN